MAKRSTPKGQQLKQIRSDLAKLKRAGLYSGDVRSAKGGWRQKSLIKQYSDVLSGKAKAVEAGKAAKTFRKAFQVKGTKVIVPVTKGEKPRYSKREGGIVSTIDEYGTKYRRVKLPGGVGLFQNLPNNPPKGKLYLFKLPGGPVMSRDLMQKQLNKYKHHKNIFQAVEIYEVSTRDFPGMDQDDIEDYLSELTDGE